MYHQVNDKKYDPRQLSVAPTHFEEHMQVIKKIGQVVQLREMGKDLNSFALGSRKIVVTLDDGYADNYYNARPILDRYEIPATFFIATGSTDSREDFWWNHLEPTILSTQILPEQFEITIAKTRYRWKIKSEEPCKVMDYSQSTYGIPHENSTLSRSRLYYVLMQLLAVVSPQERKEVLRRISDWVGKQTTPISDSLPMNSKELNKLACSPLFEIGAHTVDHVMLPFLPLNKQEEEISRSKHDLEKLIDREITSFSYPYGKYSDETVKIVERLEFKYACTVSQRPVMRDSNSYLMPRFVVSNWNGDQFEQNLRAWLMQLDL